MKLWKWLLCFVIGCLFLTEKVRSWQQIETHRRHHHHGTETTIRETPTTTETSTQSIDSSTIWRRQSPVTTRGPTTTNTLCHSGRTTTSKTPTSTQSIYSSTIRLRQWAATRRSTTTTYSTIQPKQSPVTTSRTFHSRPTTKQVQQLRNSTVMHTQNCSPPTVWHAPSRNCTTLLAQGPCQPGEWLIMLNEHPVCSIRECHPNDYLRYKNQCYKIGTTNPPCPSGMEIVALETGTGECDCRKEYVYWEPKDECYALYTQGPCGENEILIFTQVKRNDTSRTGVSCAPNPCNRGEVNIRFVNGRPELAACNATDAQCVVLNTDRGPCHEIQEGTSLTVDPKTMQLTCDFIIKVADRLLINAPLLDCAPGSRRDARGKCRRTVA